MKHRYLTFFPALAILLFPLTAYANSSWVWLTETTPLTILPFAVVFTLVTETFAVIRFGKVKKRLKTAVVVTAANLFSFLAAYFLQTIDTLYSVMDVIMHQPLYIVSIVYLLFTIIIELPVVYYSLQRGVENKRRLLLSIVISNTVTTILVFACEQIFAPGSW